MPYWFDGNNLIGHDAARARSETDTRRAFLEYLSSLACARRIRFLVFFDGDDADRRTPPRGVEVRYSAPLSADEAILRRLAGVRRPGEVIVVTNDGELRGRCRAAGARVFRWDEFASRSRAVPPAGDAAEPAPAAGDLADWSRYFGLDETELD